MWNRSSTTSSSVRAKLRVVVISSVVSLLLVGLTGMIGLLLLYGGLERQAGTYRPAYEANATALQAMTDSETSLRGYRLTDDKSFLAPYREAAGTLESALARLDVSLKGDAKLSRLALEERKATETWVQSYAIPVTAPPGTSESVRPDEKAAKATFDRFRAVNKELGDKLEAQRNHLLDRAQRLVRVTALALLLVAAAGMGLGMWPALRALRGLGPPLDRLHEVVYRIRAGDRSARADERSGFREIQDVAIALNQLLASDQAQRRDLAEELRLTKVVRDIALRVGTTLDLEAVVNFSLEAVRTGFGAKAVWVRAFEGHGERANRGFGAIAPFREDMVPPAEIVGIARRVAEECWREQRELQVSTRDSSPPDILFEDEAQRVLEFVGIAGSMSLMLIPLGAGNECLGYVILTRSANDADWTPAEVSAALGAGRDIGRAVLHARLHEREKQLVAELLALHAEKGSLAAAVSEELQTLAAISAQLEVIRTGDMGALDPAVARSLADIERDMLQLNRVVEDLLLRSTHQP